MLKYSSLEIIKKYLPITGAITLGGLGLYHLLNNKEPTTAEIWSNWWKHTSPTNLLWGAIGGGTTGYVLSQAYTSKPAGQYIASGLGALGGISALTGIQYPVIQTYQHIINSL